MKILYISKDLISGDLPVRLKKEGCDVKLFIEKKESKKNLDNLIKKIDDWEKELDWVGKDGLIIFDDVGYGKIQDKLRSEGHIVFGGSELGEKLECNREFGQQIMKKYGLKTVPLKDFSGIQKAIEYVKKHPAKWVIKQNNHKYKNITYIGNLENGSDTIDLLERYKKDKKIHSQTITLQQKIEGVEISVARYFNGNDWVGPIEISLEHTKFFPGELGPTTNEMGTLAWYTKKEKLFDETLALMKEYLKKADFRGDIAINCIVNKDGAFPLEITARIGSPIIHIQEELHLSPWNEFLFAVASGKNYDLKWKEGYGMVVFLATPPFPYGSRSSRSVLSNTKVYFDKNITEKEKNSVHFEEIAKKKNKEQFFLSDNRGYVMYITGVGRTVEEARHKAYNLINKIYVPKSFYRNDIGMSFICKNRKILKDLGFLKSLDDKKPSLQSLEIFWIKNKAKI